MLWAGELQHTAEATANPAANSELGNSIQDEFPGEREREGGGGRVKERGPADKKKQQILTLEYYDDNLCRQFSGTCNMNSLSMATGVKLNVSRHCYTEF
jgi:hypothetical protein